MLWPNLNPPGVLWKKLDIVKDCEIVWNVKFLRAYPEVGGTNEDEG